MSGFLERLTPEAIKRLRQVIRDEQIKMGFPPNMVYSKENEYQLDKMIDVMGSVTAESLIKRGMNDGLIERKVSNAR